MAAEYRGQSGPPLSAQPKSKVQGAPSESFACPYCEYRLFSNDNGLWEHVQKDHTNELDALGLTSFQGGEGFFRTLLRKNALQKGKSLADAASREDGQKEDSAKAPEGASSMSRSATDHHRRKGTRQPVRQDPPRKGTKAVGGLNPIKTGDTDPDLGYDITSKHATNLPGPSLAAQQSFHTRQEFQNPGPPLLPPHDHHLGHQPHLGPPPQKSFRSQGHPHLDVVSVSSPSAPNRSLSYPGGSHNEPSMNPRWPDLILQPDSRPISQEQLAAEVKSIYAGLVMVENKCISVDRTQATASQDDPNQPAKLASDHWQALIALHRTLLHEHHDFFLASQHPSASPALKRLALKYSMPARMWKHGIHSFLELLRRRLPESLDYMLAFIYLAYQMMALLYETVPAFEDTWIECLGDLGRYRMAIEDEDLRDRETWAGVARFWYSKAADKTPAVGRLYHHLAILARPNALQQLYYYARSLTCVQPFMSARESIMTLLDPILGRTHQTYSHAIQVDENFIRAHGILFVRDSFDKFEKTIFEYLDQLDSHIGRITSKWKEQGVHVAVTNIASLFDYGGPSVLRQMYETKLKINPRPNRPRAGETQTNLGGPKAPSTPPPEPMSEDDESPVPQELDLTSQPTFPYACRLTFSTFQLVIRRIGDRNVHLHAHVILSFLYSLLALEADCASILDNVPWDDVAYFLTTLAKSEKLDVALEQTRFPRQGEQDTKPLPEDYLIQGQIWSPLYFPTGWFNVAHDEEERFLELASTVRSRTERILWIGVQIAASGRWLRYDRGSKTWSPVQPSPQAKDGHLTQSAFVPSSGSSSEAMDIESSPVQPNQAKSYVPPGTNEPMEGVIPAYARSRPERLDKRHEKSASHRKTTKNIILRNYTIFICEKTILREESELFFKMLDSGDWKVVVPERVLIEISALSEKEPGLNETLERIRMAIKEGRNLNIADAQGNDLSDPGDAFDRLAEHEAQVKETAEDVAIGVTRRQSDLNAQGNTGSVSYPGAKPAILVSEDKAMRNKARAAGVASIAASRIRRFVSSPGRRPEGSVG